MCRGVLLSKIFPNSKSMFDSEVFLFGGLNDYKGQGRRSKVLSTPKELTYLG